MPVQQTAKRQRSGITLFRIAGIEIVIDYSWFIVFMLVLWSLSAGYFPREFPGQTVQTYWLAGSIATILFFLSVLLHELSHSLMAIRSGINIPEITLFIFGGVSRLSEEPKDPQNELKIAIVGPLSSFALAGLFWLMENTTALMQLPLMGAVFHYLMWINVALGVFNLIPGFPLDGGRVLRALLWAKTGSLSLATKWTSDMGKGFAIALMIFGGFQIFSGSLIGGMWFIFIGIFLRAVAEGGYQDVVMRQSLEGVQVKEVMVHDVISVPPDLSVDELINNYLLRYGYKGYPVVTNGRISGVVSLSNVQGVPQEEQKATTVEKIMVPLDDSLVVTPETSLAEALKKMSREEASRLLVMQDGALVGMITKTGLLRFLEIRRILESTRHH